MDEHGHGDFLRLFLANQDGLYAFALAQGVPPADADDVVQEAAAVLWRKFDAYRPGSDFRAWSFAILRLELRKWAARRSRDRRVVRLPDSYLDRLADREELEEALPAVPFEALRRCLDRLGAKARELLRWHYAEGLGLDEMARRLGTSNGALRTRLCRIRKALQDCLQRSEVAE